MDSEVHKKLLFSRRWVGGEIVNGCNVNNAATVKAKISRLRFA